LARQAGRYERAGTFSGFLRPLPLRYRSGMFETIKAELATVAGKLAHLRRFL
jgi:hypothetical protein